MPTVTMTIDEYLQLVEASGVKLKARPASPKEVAVAKQKRKGNPDPKMAKALKKANAMGRTKSGKMRKGYDQARIMRTAHKLRRKM
tara:strand:- start:569 stop:826 length:258 start_codon:yes stop_codon:yes gene_type:complete